MKITCVVLILYATFTFNVLGTEGRLKRQANNFDTDDNSEDIESLHKDNESTPKFGDNSEDTESLNEDNESTKRWGKKPGGWQKGVATPNPTPGPNNKPKPTPGPNIKPKPTPSPNATPKPTPGPTIAPNDEYEEPTILPRPTIKPTQSTVTRPTFVTTGAPRETPKPTPKPTSPTKRPKPNDPIHGIVFPDEDYDDHDSQQKPRPTPKPDPTPKPTPKHTPKPTPKPDSTPKPTPKPDSTPKPTPNPNNGNAIEPNKEENNDTPPENNEIFKCMKKCPITAEHEPVCGNNGMTFINPSHFACARKCGFAVDSFTRGTCPAKPCEPNGSSSEVIKECIRNCPVTTEHNPVCGTNGMTYNNHGRLLCAKQCGVAVDLLSKGPCRGREPPIDKDKDKEQWTTPSSSDIKQCMRNCPVTSEYDPLCGSDRVTYTNPGRLSCAKSCGANVVTVSKGVCRISAPSTKTPPIIRNTPPSAVTKACLNRCPANTEFNPVCGNDLVTYSNPGKLYCAQLCGSDVEVLSKGPCGGKNTSDPPIINENDEEQTLATPASPATPSVTPSSVARECMSKCPSTPEYNPVCGTDYVTYNSPGKLHCAQICGVNVKELRPGPCPRQPATPAAPVTPGTPSTAPMTPTTIAGSSTTQSAQVKNCMENRCPMTPEYNPVCGTNYFTYKNPGMLNCAQFCGVGVTMLRHGPCPKITSAGAPPNTTPMSPVLN